MVVCKFFQRGNCWYGQNCKFDHIYGSKYSYHAGPQPQPQPQSQPQTTTATDEQLANQVQSDVQAALKGGQWLLSCYAPFNEKPLIPGLPDIAPEEVRLYVYEAKANNEVDAMIQYINNLSQEIKLKYEQLLVPTESLLKMYRSIYKGEPVPSPFTAQTQVFGTNSASSIFRSASQNVPAFGQTTNTNNSIFGQNQSNNSFSNQQTTNIFANQSDPAKSIFASANQSVQNVFSAAQPANIFQTQNQDAAKSIFAQATMSVFGQSQPQPAPSIFGAAASQTSSNIFSPQIIAKPDAFTSSPFTSTPIGSNVFTISDQPTSNVFGTVHIDQNNISEELIYSRMEDMSPSDITAYESPDFKLGFVPEMPPPSNLCR